MKKLSFLIRQLAEKNPDSTTPVDPRLCGDDIAARVASDSFAASPLAY